MMMMMMMMMDNYRFKHLASGWPMAMAEITGKARINFLLFSRG